MIITLGCSAEAPTSDLQHESNNAVEAGATDDGPGEALERFQDAIEEQDLASLRGLLAGERRAEFEKILSSNPSPRMLAFMFLANSRLEDQQVGPVIIEGTHAVASYEGFGDPMGNFDVELGDMEGLERAVHRPIRKRVYGTAYLIRENGAWKISASGINVYADPRAQYKEPGQDGINEWTPGHHCGFRSDPSSCSEIGDLCWKCFAELRMDQDLCDQVERDAESLNRELFRDHILSGRGSCRIAVARLVGNPSICEKIPDGELFGRSLHQDCLGAVESHDFLKSTNLFLLDSDGDGLTDRIERYFNTSILNRDSDGDGVFDGEEVAEMTNPLGPGRLGDHLR